jgi:hypothetical protein
VVQPEGVPELAVVVLARAPWRAAQARAAACRRVRLDSQRSVGTSASDGHSASSKQTSSSRSAACLSPAGPRLDHHEPHIRIDRHRWTAVLARPRRPTLPRPVRQRWTSHQRSIRRQVGHIDRQPEIEQALHPPGPYDGAVTLKPPDAPDSCRAPPGPHARGRRTNASARARTWSSRTRSTSRPVLAESGFGDRIERSTVPR